MLATGGGAWMSQANRRAIDDAGTSVWLDAHPDTLWRRVRRARGRESRPLLRTENPRATLAALAEARAPTYALARLRVPTGPDLSVREVAGRVIEAARPLDRLRVSS